MFRFILFCVLIYFLFRLLKNFFSPRRPGVDPQINFSNEKGHVNEMVQDPQCGIYIAKKDAYANKKGTEVLYFCSEECCHKYLTNNSNREKGVTQ